MNFAAMGSVSSALEVEEEVRTCLFNPQGSGSGIRRRPNRRWTSSCVPPSQDHHPGSNFPRIKRESRLFLFWTVNGPFSLFLRAEKEKMGGSNLPVIANDTPEPPLPGKAKKERGVYESHPFSQRGLGGRRPMSSASWRTSTKPLPPSLSASATALSPMRPAASTSPPKSWAATIS